MAWSKFITETTSLDEAIHQLVMKHHLTVFVAIIRPMIR